MNIIETKNLTKKYKDKTAVDAINLTVEEGELFSLLGVNGAGKTTTIRMLSCLSEPTSGEAFVDGKNVNEGQVIFKINGQEYAVDVKDGVAKKTLKLSKAKKYDYTATFKDSNYQEASASSTATVKNKVATKLIVKNQKAFRGSPKAFYVTVKTASGKIVKSGKVKIIDAVKVNKKGKARFYTGTDLNYIKQVGNTVYFKKTASKTFKVKYIPASKAYKPSTAKVKITMKYRCSACGSTTSHSHPAMNMRFIVS